jgi:hypothetical protein
MSLPQLDVHTVDVAATPERTWEALNDWLLRSSARPANSRFARLLGCDQVEVNGNPGVAGSTVPGFRVARVDPP